MQKKVGQAEREFMTKSSSHFLHPLRSFLEGDMKTIGVCTMVLHYEHKSYIHDSTVYFNNA